MNHVELKLIIDGWILGNPKTKYNLIIHIKSIELNKLLNGPMYDNKEF